MVTITNKHLPHPSMSEVTKIHSLLASDPQYCDNENAVKEVFTKHPNLTDLIDVFIKCIVINDIYSTNIIDIYHLAEHIVSIKDLALRLGRGDPTLIDEIASLKLGKVAKSYYLYSFASKFCSLHNPNDFPKYDSYVDAVLRIFRRDGKFSRFKNEDLKDYLKYKDILNEFKIYYKLTSLSYFELDKYLWKTGKLYL